MAKNKFWEFKNIIGDTSADLYIYNEISSWEDEDVTSAQSFKDELDNIGNVSTINLYINSPGGSVADGLAIASMLKRNKAQVVAQVDGLACSIASVIACSADKVVMGKNCMMMIHNALSGGFFYDNAKGFRKVADDLDKISESLRATYIEKSNGKLDEEKLIELMDNETWLTAKECLELGLCDEIVEANKMVASISNKYASFFNNVPAEIEVAKDEVEIIEDVEEPLTEPTEETVDEAEEVVDEEVANEEVDELENLKQENEDLKNKLNIANESIIDLTEKINNLQVVVDKYNQIVEDEKLIKEKEELNNKVEYFKNKFEVLGEVDKFNSKEVQDLLVDCVRDKDSLLKLNQMLVDFVNLDNKKINKKVERVSKIENLISGFDEIKDKYGFK